jgi:hypothetical protein
VVRDGGTIEIHLVRGSVRAETIPGQEAEVVLVPRSDHSDPAAVRLSVDTVGSDFRVVDRYPTAAPGPRRECLPPLDERGDFWHTDVRVAALVRVPAHVRLIVRLIDGDIDVRPVSGPREVETNQGAVLGAVHGSHPRTR